MGEIGLQVLLLSQRGIFRGALMKAGESVALNCGYGRGFSVKEVLAAVERVAGPAIDVTVGERRPGDVAELVSDPSRIWSVLGW